MPVSAKRKISRKKVKRLFGWVAGISAVLVTAGFVRSETRSATCKKVNIQISESQGHRFIEPADVERMLAGPSRQPVGRKLADINITMLENMIRHNAFVAHAEVFSTIDGTLHIDIRQRKPVIRIINHQNEHFYIDETGDFMPVSSRYAANVVVATGHIFNRFTEGSIHRVSRNSEIESDQKEPDIPEPLIEQLYDLAMFMQTDPFWDAQLEQVYINEKQQIELVPRVGDQLILLGNTRQMESKFEKLRMFYKQGMDSTGWQQYQSINLLFEGQVVCSK